MQRTLFLYKKDDQTIQDFLEQPANQSLKKEVISDFSKSTLSGLIENPANSSVFFIIFLSWENYLQSDFQEISQLRDKQVRLVLCQKLLDMEKERELCGRDIYVLYKNNNCDSALFQRYFQQKIREIRKYIENKSRLHSYISDSFKTIVDNEIITKQKMEIELLNRKLEHLSRIDPLTNLLNRRAFFEAISLEKKRTDRDLWRLQSEVQELEKKKRRNKPLGKLKNHLGVFSCFLCDIDHFKHINDNFGHQVGDKVLRSFGELLHKPQVLRENDIAARYGGEEFIIVLPETNSEHALIPARRLKEQFSQMEFISDKGVTFHVSISIGIAEYRQEDKSVESLIKRADMALYYAKDNGRDRIVVYDDVFT